MVIVFLPAEFSVFPYLEVRNSLGENIIQKRTKNFIGPPSVVFLLQFYKLVGVLSVVSSNSFISLVCLVIIVLLKTG